MNTTKDKSSAFGSRFNMYRLPLAGFAYNPDLREWEVFELSSDGSIQDLCERFDTRTDAEQCAQKLSAELSPVPLQLSGNLAWENRNEA